MSRKPTPHGFWVSYLMTQARRTIQRALTDLSWQMNHQVQIYAVFLPTDTIEHTAWHRIHSPASIEDEEAAEM
jgi:hypothetical protein